MLEPLSHQGSIPHGPARGTGKQDATALYGAGERLWAAAELVEEAVKDFVFAGASGKKREGRELLANLRSLAKAAEENADRIMQRYV